MVFIIWNQIQEAHSQLHGRPFLEQRLKGRLTPYMVVCASHFQPGEDLSHSRRCCLVEVLPLLPVLSKIILSGRPSLRHRSLLRITIIEMGLTAVSPIDQTARGFCHQGGSTSPCHSSHTSWNNIGACRGSSGCDLRSLCSVRTVSGASR